MRRLFFFLAPALILTGCWDKSNPVVTSGPRLGGNPGGGGDGVSNGGGLGEKNLIFAFYGLGENLQACMESSLCALNDSDYEVVRRIRTALRDRVETIEGIKFKSEIQNPGFFWLQGRPKTALTGTRPGSVVYVNVDQLYLPGEAGTRHPISVAESTALLIHELAHHQGIGSSDGEIRRLDQLTATIGQYLERAKFTLPGAAARLQNETGRGSHTVPLLNCESLDDNSPFDWGTVQLRKRDSQTSYSLYLHRAGEGVERGKETFVRLSADKRNLRVTERRAFDSPLSLAISLKNQTEAEADSQVKFLPTGRLVFRYSALLNIGPAYRWQCQLSENILNLQSPLWAFFLR